MIVPCPAALPPTATNKAFPNTTVFQTLVSVVRKVHVFPSGLVMAPLVVPPVIETATNTPFP